jgi:hypothetical protein
VVAFLLYAYDSARLLAPHDLLLVEAGRGRLRPLLTDNPFTAGGRTLTCAPLHLPHRGVFLAAWGGPGVARPELAATLDSLERLRGRLAPVRGLAALAFVLLFGLGPAVTLALGPSAGVLAVAALLYPTVVAAIVVIWRRRHDFGLTARRAAWLGLEILVCPAFLPNLVRRLTGERPLEPDGVQVVAATAAADVRDEFLGRLRARAETLLDATGADAAAQERLRAYLAGLPGMR